MVSSSNAPVITKRLTREKHHAVANTNTSLQYKSVPPIVPNEYLGNWQGRGNRQGGDR